MLIQFSHSIYIHLLWIHLYVNVQLLYVSKECFDYASTVIQNFRAKVFLDLTSTVAWLVNNINKIKDTEKGMNKKCMLKQRWIIVCKYPVCHVTRSTYVDEKSLTISESIIVFGPLLQNWGTNRMNAHFSFQKNTLSLEFNIYFHPNKNREPLAEHFYPNYYIRYSQMGWLDLIPQRAGCPMLSFIVFFFF